MIPGYTPFFKTLPVAKIANIHPEMPETANIDPNISNISSTLENKNTDTEELIERSAIVEHDGETTRDRANRMAAEAYDRQRQSYEFANPDRDPAGVEALYRAYIFDWQPDEYSDLPAVPPCTRNNTDLWKMFWEKIEEGRNNG